MTRSLRRSLLVTAATTVMLLTSGPMARAGTFTITSCTGAQPTAAPWVSVRNAVWTVTSESCRPDPGSGWIAGMWAYPTYGQGGGPADSSARWRFAVNPPLVIRRVRGTIAFKQAGGISSGILDESNFRWLLGGPGCAGACEIRGYGPFDLTGLNSQSVSLPIYCGLAWCGLPPADALAQLRDVEVTVEDPTPPAVVATGGTALSGTWQSGDVTLAYRASDETGIARTEVFVDGQQKTSHGVACSPTQIPACATVVDDGVTLSTRLFAGDGAHTVTVRATAFSGNVSDVPVRVLSDNTAPVTPLELGLDGPAWQATPAFDVHWRNPAQVDRAPIRGASWRLCPVGETDTSK